MNNFKSSKFKNKRKYFLILFILLIFISGVLQFIFGPISKVFAAVLVNELNIAAGVVPHHLLAKEIIDDFFKYILSQKKPETIILLSPDHLHSATLNQENSFITVALEPGKEEFDHIKVDSNLLKKLAAKNKMVLNNSAVASEFGITNLLPFIEKYFPETKILPVLIPADISKEQITQLVNSIDEVASVQTIIIASVDFSHYLPLQSANFHDVKSIRVLLNLEKNNFENLEIDCWQGLYAVRLFAKLRQREVPQIIAHKNSADLLKLNLEETTSYFSVIFEEKYSLENFAGSITTPFPKEVKTILLTGDMMLDRGVEDLIKQNSIYYPFQRISQFLRGVDIVFGNLEGPVVKNPPEFPDHSLKFACNSEVMKGISWANFNLLSLANNHTLNLGKEGLEETKDWLRKYQVNFVGDPLSGSWNELDSYFSSDNIIFLAFNQIFPFLAKEEEIIETVKAVKSLNSEKFLIISLHWGEEYQLTNSLDQQKLAHQIIEAGADLIIGHHPHVVQNIEMYQGKLIFYSLGNFIFDQYFSLETQQGLAVGLEVHSNKLIFRLFPLQINLGQPVLMKQSQESVFLIKLAKRSDRKLVDAIKSGIIQIERLN